MTWCMLVCLFTFENPLLLDWRLLVEEHIANIGNPLATRFEVLMIKYFGVLTFFLGFWGQDIQCLLYLDFKFSKAVAGCNL